MIASAILNSSCLIGLSRIERLEIIPALCRNVGVPDAVVDEVGFRPAFAQVFSVENRALVASLTDRLGRGEAEAIALAAEKPGSVVVLDERKARSIARRLGISLTGTLALVAEARRRGIVDSAQAMLDDLAKAGFRISEGARVAALELAGEA